ncbi:hypothetical protein SH2C18_37080 [Clostridium sediminicola]
MKKEIEGLKGIASDISHGSVVYHYANLNTRVFKEISAISEDLQKLRIATADISEKPKLAFQKGGSRTDKEAKSRI